MVWIEQLVERRAEGCHQGLVRFELGLGVLFWERGHYGRQLSVQRLYLNLLLLYYLA